MEPCNVAPPALAAQLRRIEPSVDIVGTRHRGCRLVLKDGRTIERALCIEDRRGFHSGGWIHPEEIAEAAESPYRLPPRLATKLYAAGESGMGYVIFVVRLRSREEFVCVTEGIVDFPDFPPGVTGRDVAAVRPHEGREKTRREGFRRSAPFEFCYFVFGDGGG